MDNPNLYLQEFLAVKQEKLQVCVDVVEYEERECVDHAARVVHVSPK